MKTNPDSLLVLDYQNLWHAMCQKVALADVRNKIESKHQAHIPRAVIFLAEYFVVQMGATWKNKLYDDACRFGFEIKAVSRPPICYEMDFVDIAIMEYCEQKAPEIKSLILGSSDADFAQMFLILRTQGIEVTSAYYDMPSIKLLQAANHHIQLKNGCMCRNKKRFLAGP